MRSSRLGLPTMRSDRPWPRLSKLITLAKVASRRKKSVYPGSSWKNSTCDTSPGTMTRSIGPSPMI